MALEVGILLRLCNNSFAESTSVKNGLRLNVLCLYLAVGERNVFFPRVGE